MYHCKIEKDVTQCKNLKRAERLQLSVLRFFLAADWEYCLESILHEVFISCDLQAETCTFNGGKGTIRQKEQWRRCNLGMDSYQSCFFLWIEKILLLLCIYRYAQRASAWLLWVFFFVLICNMSKHECLCSDTFNKNQQFSLIKGLINHKHTRRNNYFRIHCSSQMKPWRTAAEDKKLSLILNCFATRWTNAWIESLTQTSNGMDFSSCYQMLTSGKCKTSLAFSNCILACVSIFFFFFPSNLFYDRRTCCEATVSPLLS